MKKLITDSIQSSKFYLSCGKSIYAQHMFNGRCMRIASGEGKIGLCAQGIGRLIDLLSFIEPYTFLGPNFNGSGAWVRARA